jgi:hypothetical protein
MSVIELAAALPAVPIGQPKTRWFKAPDAEDDPADALDFDNWPKAARRLWKILLRRVRITGSKVITLPVWKLAEMCGRGLRWVWKALRQLLELGMIRRFWCHGRIEVENRKGHQGEVGRATEILVDLAGPEPKAKPAPKAKAKPAAKPTSTGTGALAAIKATIAAAAAEKPADPPGDAPTPSGFDWRKMVGIPAASSQRRDPNDDPQYRAIKAEMEAKEQARRARERLAAQPSDQLPAEPAGPEVPADSGS